MKAIPVLLSAAALSMALTFTTQPSISYNAGNGGWTISFAVSETADVEVTVVKVSDSSIVRRLVAGKLGAHAPAPLSPNSLSQAIAWDGRDDLGARVDSTLALSVRVRAGMSVALDRMTADNPYYFGGLSGVMALDDGSLIIQGVHEYGRHSRIRQYDKYGEYQRTLFPLPAGLASAQLPNWDVVSLGGSGYRPAYGSYVAGLRFASDQFLGTTVMPFTSDNRLVFCNRTNFSCISVHPGDMSRINGPVKLITAPSTSPNAGPFLFNRGASAGSDVVLTGAYHYRYDYVTDPSGYSYKFTISGMDTGFWQDGCLYKLNLLTGVTSLWKDLIPRDSIPDFRTVARNSTIGPLYSQPGDWTTKSYAAIHGLAFDDSGRVYICDRLRRRVAVYDTATWTLQGSITVRCPHLVEVNRKTGDVFVLSWSADGFGGNIMHIYKYPGFRDNPASSAHFSMIPGDPSCNFGLMPTIFTSCDDGDGTLLYTGAGSAFLILRDTDNGFSKVKDFDSLSRDEQTYKVPAMYERLAVDRRTETIYTSNAWEDLYRISDWVSCKAVPCSTSSRLQLHAAEAAVSPDGFYLYAREAQTPNHESGWAGPVKKYAIGPYLTPANFKSSNQVHDYFSGKWGAWFADKGLAVSREGRIAISDGFDDMDNVIQVTDADSTFHDSVIYPLGEWGRGGRFGLQPPRPYNSGGVKYDFEGNLYVGSDKRAPDHVIPQGYEASTVYLKGVGAVYKFPSSGGSIYMDSVRGALKVYPQGLGAFSGDEGGGTCRCRSPRFDLDPYGRLFIPNGFLSRVVVADNSGNDILEFGEYGNADSRGPGSLVPGPVIPLATPQCVAASDNYIYVTDWNNARLVRVRMNFELENMHLPEVGLASADRGHDSPLSLIAFPNPFNPDCRISYRLPERSARPVMAVYSQDGRLVADLPVRAGAGSVVWNGRNRQGAAVASGMYLVRLSAGERVLNRRIMLLK